MFPTNGNKGDKRDWDMGKTPDNSNAIGKMRRKPSCRIAYSINDKQPVLCTIISDQPFFYMDDVLDYDDEAILSDEDTALYESLDIEIAELKTKINSYERMSLNFVQPRDKALQDFIVYSDQFKSLKAENRHEISTLEIIKVLKLSRYASALYEHAISKNITLKMDSQVERSILDKDAKAIFINPSQSLEKAVFAAVRELRHYWQISNGTGLHPLAFHPDHAVLVNRAQIADLQTAIIRASWELKLAGENSYWAEIENSSHADLGRSFAREALVDFRTINSGKASSAVFETWFLSDRCGVEDRNLIQMMLGEYQGYMIGQTQTSKIVSIDLITQLGAQPFGKNYLAPYAQMILNDPIFTDVRDRSNANFLWFIKFERSFDEAEQELQTSSLNQERDVHHAFFNNKDNHENMDLKEDTHNDANVITINFARDRSHANEQKS